MLPVIFLFQQPTSRTTAATTSSDDVQFIAGPFKATYPRKSLPQKLAVIKHKNKEARERTDVFLLKQRENLNCHICLSIVNRPFILSCGHFFCAECISECAKYHVQKRTNPRCPDCRVITGHFTPIEAHHLQQMAVALRSELGIPQPPRGSLKWPSIFKDLLGSLKDEPLKLSSLSSPPDLSSKSTSSPDNAKPKLHWPSAAAASDLRSKYQTLSRHADEASNYNMSVMAAAISSGMQSATPQLPSIERSLHKFQAEITKQTVKSMLSASAGTPSVEENSLESLLVPDRHGRLQFGDPRKSSAKSILCAVEDGSDTLRREIASSTAAVSVEAKEVRGVLDSIQQSVQLWRTKYPNTAPVKIDNRKCFFDPTQDKNSPTVIAYCIALVARVFERTAQRGATFILKMIKIFGYTLATLGGRTLNTDQEIALAGIPESIERLEKKFNLDVDCVPYAVCPKCSMTYAPSFPNGASHPVYPPICLERQTSSEEPCNASLLSYGKPAKIFEYYPFFDWFGKFISLPRIEEYSDKFCEAVESHQNVPIKKVDQTDSCFVHEFLRADAQLFIADRNRIRGKKSSTGMMAMSCLNLPLKMRNDHAYLYVPGIIQGPHEPNAINAEHRYTRGIRPYATHRTYGKDCPYDRIFRVALALVLMDFKAARPFSGFLDVTSHHFCYMCDCWHVSHLGRTDYEEWKSADDAFLRKGAELWCDAPDTKKRKILEDMFGTRASEFWRLPYWKASIQLGIDPMHTMFLILLQRYFRDILGLDNPDDPKRTPKKPKFKFAFYHNFTPPPPLSSLISNDSRARQAVLDILNDLSERAPVTEAQKHQLYSRIQRHKWSAILYVCDNLAIFPNERPPDLRNSSQITQKDVTKRELSNILLHWRTHEIREEQLFIWPYFTPTDIPPPVIPWATHHASTPDHDNPIMYRKFTPGERSNLLRELAASMTYHSASHVGNLHRLLQKPLVHDHKDDLRKALKQSNGDALTYVCADIDRLPAKDVEAARANAINQVRLFQSLAENSTVMAKRTLSVERRNLYRHLLRLHILGLKQDFPGWIFPTHHLAFHIFDGMNNFSGVRNWWLFPFENLIGKLQRIPTNHITGLFILLSAWGLTYIGKIGQFEHTMLHSFCKGASFRQWLLRENSPPILRYCQQLLDKAYNYDRGSSAPPPPVAPADDIDDSEGSITVDAELVTSNFAQPDSKYKILPSPTLTRLLRAEPFECFSRIPGSKGDYTIPGEGAIGNSNICFQAQGTYRPGQRWIAGQIRHIFRRTQNGPLQAVICWSMPASTPHPFADYWANGFEADMVASNFSDTLEIITLSQIAGHIARWSITNDLVVVVNLCSVSLIFVYLLFTLNML
ncbi:hypothetical protein C8R41DRAFT_869747 [Lentinula lateritia]|uniref:RING-type domain-containing protein n=1 Tax=Lentinula lateritia TaxID=40482 RepID=A0ABQ8V671_9AGAR|nr:hypothetical protein C8R41DRAFT_869747 [Lentinula lateritia]